MDKFSIPMPSDSELDRQIIAGGSPWNWGFSGQASNVDPSTLSREARERVLDARLRIGPTNGDAYAEEAHAQLSRLSEIEKDRAELLGKLTAVKFDEASRRTVPVYSDEDRAAFQQRIDAGKSEEASLKGAYGAKRLQDALAKARDQRKASLRQEYIEAEAQKLVAQDELAAAIRRRADVIQTNKSGGHPRHGTAQ